MDPLQPKPDRDETLPHADAEASGSVSMWVGSRASGLPHSIGGYRILGLLGQGGMGQVYLAEQETPKRTVALKVIRPGPGGDQLFKRFLHEVSVLGMLKHHGIAQIYDAGVAESQGRSQPYFAMELVKGKPIGEHAASAGLDTAGRLELFSRVCDAVQHAHYKGVIHRDLKPGNILVEEGGQPKILDFGVARATNHDLQAVTHQTDIGQLVGTLSYMSPEQISGDPSELDTRSDVYTLGVVLFELLAGRLPHDISSRAITEAIRIVSECEVPRVSSIACSVASDVDTIVAKAMDRDKSRRYQSAGDLAEDIRRYLRDEPIHARPPSSIYQLTKFAKRHKPLVGASAAVLVAIIAGVIGIAWQGVIADGQRRIADEQRQIAERERERVERERERAEIARKKAEAVTEFLQGMLQSADPSDQHGREARIADVLPVASSRVETEMKDQPELQAAIWETIGETYFGLGMYAEAETEFMRSLKAFEGLTNADIQDAARIRQNVLRLRHNVAVVKRHQGRLEEAETLLREVAAMREEEFGPAHIDTLRSLDNLATVLRRRGKLDEAGELYRQVLSRQERELGVDHKDTLDTRNNLALVLRDLGRLGEAETLLRQTLAQKERVYDSIKTDHPEVLATRHNLGRVLADQGRLAEAEAVLKPTLEARARELGPDHARTLATRLAFAEVRFRSNDIDTAEAMLREVIDAMLKKGLPQDATTLGARDALACVLEARGEFVEAESQAMEAVATATIVHGADNWITADYRRALGCALTGLGREAEAEAVLIDSVRVLTDRLGPMHWRTLLSRERLATLLDGMGRVADAATVRTGGLPHTR